MTWQQNASTVTRLRMVQVARTARPKNMNTLMMKSTACFVVHLRMVQAVRTAQRENIAMEVGIINASGAVQQAQEADALIARQKSMKNRHSI